MQGESGRPVIIISRQGDHGEEVVHLEQFF
jgi:hypothetical protein